MASEFFGIFYELRAKGCYTDNQRDPESYTETIYTLFCAIERPMNKEEANAIFKSEVERFRTMPYNEFVQVIENDVYTAEHVGASGTRYLIELKTRRKKRKKNIVRVSASLRSLDEPLEESKTWNIPVLNIPICFATMSGIFTCFTRRPESSHE